MSGRLLLAAGLVAIAGSAHGAALWRGPVPADGCQVVLVNELGDVRVGPGPPSGPPAIVITGDPGLAIEAAASARSDRLSVRAAGTPPAASTAVELSVPTGCSVTVRTAAGAVDVMVPSPSAPLVVETITGDITARVAPMTTPTALVATSGEITTDYTIEIELAYHTEPAKRGWVGPGPFPDQAGTADIRLTSRQGAVPILRAE